MTHQKDKALTNLKKVRSLMDKMIKMVEQDMYCIDIMQQNLSAIGMLRSAHEMLMENHLNHCFSKALDTNQKKKKEEMVKEILTVTKLVNK